VGLVQFSFGHLAVCTLNASLLCEPEATAWHFLVYRLKMIDLTSLTLPLSKDLGSASYLSEIFLSQEKTT
jgi:hypothetical protein